MLEAVQSLSSRLDSIENRQSDNSTDHSRGPPNRQPSSSQALLSSFGFLTASGPSNGPTDPDDGDGDEGDDDEEELIQDESPTTEPDLVDSRSSQHAKIDPIPYSAADYRVWKNGILLLMGRIDLSWNDYLPSWLSVAFKVDSSVECMQSSGLVPRLDRWLASELIKGLQQVPELQFKVQGYVQN